MQNKSLRHKLTIYAILIFGSLVMVYPFVFQVMASLGSNHDYYNTLVVPIPTSLHFDRYLNIFSSPSVYQLYLNTLIRCIWYITTTCFFALVLGYVFSKLRFKGRDASFLILLSSLMIPGQVVLIPNYLLFARWPFAGGNDFLGQGGHGLLNSWYALMLGGLIPVYAIFLMKQMMDTLPYEYEEAARCEGAGTKKIIFSIYFPMVKPILAALCIMTFIGYWNDYLWPLVVMSSPTKQVIATGIASIMAQWTTTGQVPEYPEIFALSTIAMLPPILVYLWLQKYFIEAFVMTGVKG